MNTVMRFLSTSPAVHAAVGLWLPVMIALPLVARRGGAWRARAISGGVYVQVILVVVILSLSWRWDQIVTAFAAVAVLGWLAEYLGTRTKVPFGDYHYTASLQPQLHRVPVVIPLAWVMMLAPAWATSQLLFPSSHWWIRALVSGAAFTAWDIYLDPHLTRWGFWRWRQKGRFEGIPISNFLGWFLWSTIISGVVLALVPTPLVTGPLVGIYLLTWLFHAGGHLFFWRWPISGISGFIAMGAFSVPAFVRIILS